MKGRFNEKPSEEYHKYIVDLLMSRFVNGIKGGGYDPGRNFHMTDLSAGDQEKVLKANPDLETASMRFEREGFTPAVEEAIINELDQVGLPDIHGFNPDDKYSAVQLQHFDDIADLSRNIYWDKLNDFVKFLDDRENYDDVPSGDEIQDYANSSDPREEDYADLLHYLSDRYIERIADDMRIDGDLNDRKTISHMAQYVDRQSKYSEWLRIAMVKSQFENTPTVSVLTDEELWEYAMLLVSTIEMSMEGGSEVATIDVTQPNFDAQFILTTSFANLFAIMSAGSMDGDDYAYEDESYRFFTSARDNSEWLSLDTYRLDDDWEYRRDESEDGDLIKKVGSAIGNDDTGDWEFDSSKINFQDAAHYFSKMVDMYESVDEEDEIIMEMKKRAGLL